jgi:D-alanyl-lipoteichoic acid acyltransferase DltB (MBOAT superfamily)
MLFNSFEYLLFFPLVFFLYWSAFSKNKGIQNLILIFASYFFYGWWSWKFLLLLIVSTLLDYLYGFGVNFQNKKYSKLFLWLSIINNLGILCVFKYFNFFIDQLKEAVHLAGYNISPIYIEIALPVGISFYTFHGMSYVFDIYRKQRMPVKNFIDYSLFVSFFPLLVAGPIERANHLIPQIEKERRFNFNQSIDGGKLILWGMFKKVVVADSLAIIADRYFENPGSNDAFFLIIGILAFSFQIYCDFSGYSDIAIGSAKLLGFELLSNFRFPYFSRDIAEFWRRWHISLTTWFRDYLYIPLGGSKMGKLKAIRNTFIIFVISGFWHGASWNFIIWGVIHALLFLPLLLRGTNRINSGNVVANGNKLPSFNEFFQMIITFFVVSIAWVFFRSENLSSSLLYLSTLFKSIFLNPSQFFHIGRHLLWPSNNMALIWIFILIFIEWRLRYNERSLMLSKIKWLNWSFYLLIGFLTFNTMLSYFDKVPKGFIYFQF